VYVEHRLNRVTVERHREITMADSGLWGMVEPVYYYFFFWHDSPQMGQGLLINEFSRSHTKTHHRR
jgi:hypothetical protein